MQFKIIYIVNLWLDRQVIGLIFPIHCSEHFAMQNVASELAIGFIFPIQWSELSTSVHYKKIGQVKKPTLLIK